MNSTAARPVLGRDAKTWVLQIACTARIRLYAVPNAAAESTTHQEPCSTASEPSDTARPTALSWSARRPPARGGAAGRRAGRLGKGRRNAPGGVRDPPPPAPPGPPASGPGAPLRR